MTETPRAVFLSYASQDAEAAQRICQALRAGGIEVWFDWSELRGGDAWDQSIRRQIKTCLPFLPIISHTTHERREGYFRLEWKLAIDRCHLMDADLAFLLPVVIDDTRDDDERVPERFREVQWTRLPGGETAPAFVERVSRLLSPETSPALARTHSAASTGVRAGPAPARAHPAAGWSRVRRHRNRRPAASTRVFRARAARAIETSRAWCGFDRSAAAHERKRRGEPAILLRWDLGGSDHRARAVPGTQSDRAQLGLSVQRFQEGQPQQTFWYDDYTAE